jgi:hypothetical protein
MSKLMYRCSRVYTLTHNAQYLLHNVCHDGMLQCCGRSPKHTKKASSADSDVGNSVESKSSSSINKHANSTANGDGVPATRCCGLIKAVPVAHPGPHDSARRSTLRMSDTPQIGSAIV